MKKHFQAIEFFHKLFKTIISSLHAYSCANEYLVQYFLKYNNSVTHTSLKETGRNYPKRKLFCRLTITCEKALYKLIVVLFCLKLY